MFKSCFISPTLFNGSSMTGSVKSMLVVSLSLVFLLGGCSDQAELSAPDQGSANDEMNNSAAQAEAASAAAEAADRLAEAVAEKQAARQARIDEGQAYLHINAQKPGVKVLESGLQFEILEQGEGNSPDSTDIVVTHYHGTFINGDVFDSSVERGQPAEFPVNRVIKGWTEALQMMQEGDVWRLVIPSHLAYGERGAGNTIPPDSVLVFDVELIKVKD